MRPRITLAAASLAALLAAACGKDGPMAPTAGALSINLTTPNTFIP